MMVYCWCGRRVVDYLWRRVLDAVEVCVGAVGVTEVLATAGGSATKASGDSSFFGPPSCLLGR